MSKTKHEGYSDYRYTPPKQPGASSKAAWDIPNGISVCEAGNAQNPGVIGFTAFIDTDADETHTLLKKWGKLLKSKGDNR